ncbi:MAG: PAS domain S-box-containing protein [Flavobacteriales bacterium]
MSKLNEIDFIGFPICSINVNGVIESYTSGFEAFFGGFDQAPISVWQLINDVNQEGLVDYIISQQKPRSVLWDAKCTKTNLRVKVTFSPRILKSGEDGASLMWEKNENQFEENNVSAILHSINSNLKEGFYRASSDGDLVFVNEGMVEMFGFDSAEEMRQFKAEQFYLNPSNRNEIAAEISMQGHITNREILFKRKDGNIFWGLLSATLVNSRDGIISFDGALRDISNIKEIERQLKIEAQKAEAGSRSKQQFLSTMSHELRTPLNAVIGLAHLLMTEEPKKEQIDNLKSLLFSAEGLLGLINLILDFSKIDAGRVQLEESVFSLNTLLCQIKDTFQIRSKAKSLNLIFDLDEASPLMLIGDAHRLTQIFNNLVSNAIKFTFHGDVILQTKVIDVSDPLVSIQFSVKDSGIGIPESKQKSIFSLFTQASSSTTRKFGGTGLGLAITKKLIELHDAELTVDSIPGEGSEFRFVVTFKVPDETAIAKELRVEPVVGDGLKGKRILAAEDNQVNQLLLRKFVTSWGAEIVIADNGLEVVDYAQSEKFDLILMDIQMPLMDGYTASRKIRQMEGVNCDVPIVAVTASAMGEVSVRCKDAGMSAIVLKPYSPASLKMMIESHIK